MLFEDSILAEEVPSLLGETAAMILTWGLRLSLNLFTLSGFVVIIEFLHWFMRRL